MSEPLPEGYIQQIRQAPTLPLLWGGVPRNLGIWNTMLTVCAVAIYHWWWVGPIGLVIHLGAKALTRRDPYWLDVLGRVLREASYYDG